jgi:hypothetical protein
MLSKVMTTASFLWRRLDSAGHDACRLVEGADGWRLEGTAVFRDEGRAVHLAYEVTGDRQWRSQRGKVRGWIGVETVDITLARTEGAWTLDGAVVPGLEGCVDLDLGFTPATNVIPVRRLRLDEGQAGDAPAAWLDAMARTLQRLPQRYERRSQTSYWYESPTTGYFGLLDFTPEGFIRVYPGLWEAER